MLLSKPVIKRLIASKHITIDEFKPENLGSAQYDLTLGEHFYRERECWGVRRAYNPFDEKHVRERWVLDRPISHEDWIERSGERLVNVGLDEKLILLKPGEMILGHTQEFIGGSCDFITTKMYARSSLGRNGVEVCRCAGLGDVGYFTRWTMEIVNTSRFDRILLPVGRRVAQLVFFQVEPVAAEDVYSKQGKYQDSNALENLKAAWTHEQMLPKQWLDRESRRVREADEEEARLFGWKQS
jgi:dCTP deaminase